MTTTRWVVLALAMLLVSMPVFASVVDPYVYFGGISGVHSIAAPNTFTVNSFLIGPFRLTPATVTFEEFSGTGTCQFGSCTGTASTSLQEKFNFDALAIYLPNLPNASVTASYLLDGALVLSTTQVGGTLHQPMSPGFAFDTLQLAWSQPVNFDFTFETFDSSVPEPASLSLAGLALLAGFAGLRRL